ncbi:MAG: hypothetical protein JXQ90_19075 [Cyclobacteriaceae bacterium]
MSSLKQTQHTSDLLTDAPNLKISSAQSDELTINLVSSYEQSSAISDELKKQKQKDAPDLAELLQKTLTEKGGSDKCTWTGESEVTVEGLSSMTLHSFVLKAEELGKTIKYTKSLKVEITD